ncbi:zinc ABC transporter substrate-binding protein [Anaerococcus sp. AGMB09787]|uniref:metal ABC transporter solute-binding protein, Zn/Mn family n=1 Tax=Anaerococcus sp. AGMB09787 TaxID=2922869 RepID=UPI001FAF9F85|nr:zinc ABC transporter substrate-binding protein [Anaerococcus sp. AGMB09787]
MKNKKIITLLALSLALTACGNNNQGEPANIENTEVTSGPSTEDSEGVVRPSTEKEKSEENEESSVVYASFYPIYNLTKQIAGDKFEVKSFTNLKTESHGFEPSAKEIADLSEAGLIFINGAGMEEWAEDVEENVETDFVNTSENIEYIKAEGGHVHDHEEGEEDHEHEEGEDHDHEHEEDHEHEDVEDNDHEHEDVEEHDREEEGHHHHNHGEFDPHTWLDPENGKEQAKVIADKLSEIDPANKDYFQANYQKIADELDAIVNEYSEKFSSVENKKFIVPHEAFGYLAKRFDLEQIPLNNLTSTGETDAKVLKEVTDLAKEEKLKVVFYEKGGSDEEAKTLANEIGATAEPISTIEFASDEELENEVTYQELIKENLEAIYNSLA